MLKKVASAVFFASLLPIASESQVSINIGPPPVVVEHPGPPPPPGYVW